MSEILPTEDLKNVSDCTSAQMQELNDVKEFFKIQRNKYNKYKILYAAVQESVSNSNYLDSDLKVKIQDILLANNCSQVLDLESEGFSQQSQVLLGLTDVNNDELSYIESVKVKKVVETILENKYKNICKQFLNIAGKEISMCSLTEDFGNFSLSHEDQLLLELKRKLQEQQQKYVDHLQQEQKVLEDICELRLEKMPQVCNDKVKECEMKTRISELQSKIVQEKSRIDIFMETTNSLPAYEELMKDIKVQQDECERDIQYLKKLKMQYQQISCRQYDDLLKSFMQYKTSLAKKKMIYESLQS